MRSPTRFVTLLAAVTLPLLAACGTSTSAGTASSGASASGSGTVAPAGGSGTFPATVKGASGDVTVPARPKAIVSLSPSLTEMLFAIGAGPQVKAVDDQSDYPAQAPRTKLSGFQPNAEAIAAYAPDLVVISDDTGGLVAALTKLKLPVLVLPAPTTLDDGYAQEVTLGAATGHPAQAQQTIDATKRRIAAAVAAVPPAATARKVYHEVDPTYYSVTSATFIGNLYHQFNLTNIADAAPKVSGGYPKLSAEFVVSSAPDLIVLADSKCCQATAATVAKRPAFATVPAVKNGKVVAVDDDIASRWGPRIADFAEQIARALGAAA